MKRYHQICIVMIVSLFIGTGIASADEVWLVNGDHVSGKVVRLESELLVLKTEFAGDINIEWEKIARLKTDEAVTVVVGGDTVIKGTLAPAENDRIAVQSDDIQAPVTLAKNQIKIINPKPPEPALKTKVRVNLGASATGGNTESESIYGDGELVARTAKNRFTLGAVYKRAKDNDVTTVDSITGYLKYDHFLTQKWYLFTNATGEKDEFKDLNLRSTLGLGAGYQFFDSEITSLSLEAGASYINEDFISIDDNAYSAGRWSLRLEHYLFKKSMQFFHIHTGLQSFESSDDFLFYSQTGIRVPLYKNLSSTLQFNYDYAKNPSPGRENDDTAIIFSLGYQWGE